MTAIPNQHAWSSEALFNKALLYVEEMERYTANDWQFGFWASLSLELLARSAVAYISPTLLASGSDWRNTYHALGHAPTAKRFNPNSIATYEVMSMLNELVPEFTKELFDFCVVHSTRRNTELHTGEDVFAKLGTSEWLPKYYASCDVFLRYTGKSLAELFERPEAAQNLIASLKDTAAKAVERDIKAYQQVWSTKTPEEREEALAQAISWAGRHTGHRVKCPACASPAIVHGSGQGTVFTSIGEDQIVQKQTMLPSSFECIACKLRITGLSKLSACGLGDAFTATSKLSAAEFFNLHTDEELEEARSGLLEPEWEPDFND